MESRENEVEYETEEQIKLRLMRLSKVVPLAQVRGYLRSKWPDKTRTMKGAFSEPSDENRARMIKLTFAEGALLLSLYSDPRLTIEATTFTITSVLLELGYTLVEHGPVTEQTDLGDTVLLGKDRFPYDCDRYLVAEKLGSRFFFPIQGGFIDTNFFYNQRVRCPRFVQSLAETVRLVGTFFSLKNGNIEYVMAGEAGEYLLNFSKIIPSDIENTRFSIGCDIEKWMKFLPAPRGDWSTTTMHGTDFCHHFYLVMPQVAGIPSRMNALMDAVNKLVVCYRRVTADNGKSHIVPAPFIENVKGVICTSSTQFMPPNSILNYKVDIIGKSADLDQAYYALSLGRNFRGANSGSKGSLTRDAYLPCHVHGDLADLVYLETDMKVWLPKAETIILLTGAVVGNKIKHILDVLRVHNFKGMVVAEGVPAVSGLLNSDNLVFEKYGVKGGTYKNGQFRVLFGTPMMTAVTGQIGNLKLNVDTTVTFDIRYVGNEASYNRTAFLKYNEDLGTLCSERVQEWDRMNTKVVGRLPMCGKLISMFGAYETRGFHLYSAVELHHLMVWGTKGITFDVDWLYDIKDNKTFKEVCCASIVANIVKCLRALLKHNVLFVLKKIGFKVPDISLRAIGQMTINEVKYLETKIELAYKEDPASLLKMFSEGDVLLQSVMLADENKRRIILDEGSSSNAAKPPDDEKGEEMENYIDMSGD